MLNPKIRSLGYSFITGITGEPCKNEFRGSLDDYRDRQSIKNLLLAIKHRISQQENSFEDETALITVFHLPYGGSLFRAPELLGPGTLDKLKELIPQDPLHLPAALTLIDCADEVFDGCAQVLISETAFFVDLPPRERLDALDLDLIKKMGIRHYGFNGTLHQAACRQVISKRRLAGLDTYPKIASICLQSHPEVAAVIGRRPVMVTGGTTPLEGIPGNTTCGELDPGIVLTLVQKPGWGPEHINQVLTRESGLKGLTGEQTDLEAVFTRNKKNYRLAREIIRYRLLMACGAAKAAMGGLDTIAFSGKYVKLGEILGPWLISNLVSGEGKNSKTTWEMFGRPPEKVIAEIASAVAAACPVG